VEPTQVPQEDVLIEKQERGKRLVLRRGGDVSLRRQVTQESRDLGLAETRWVTLAAPENKALDPVHVSLLRAPAVVQPLDRVAHLPKQAGPRVLRGFTS